MKKINIVGIVFLMLSTGLMAFAQEVEANTSNDLSIRPIDQNNVLYKTTLWRRVDLREKQNQPLFAKNSEITKIIIDGVKAGLLDAYSSDSLNKKLTIEEFNQSLFKKFEGGGLSQDELDAGFGTDEEGWGTTTPTTGGGDDGWGDGGSSDSSSGGDDGWGDGGSSNTTASNLNASSTKPASSPASNAALGGYEIFPQELYLLEIREDWVFDKQRSRQYFDIQTVSLKMPAELSTEGLEMNIATFKYRELEQYFRHNKDAIWYNVKNQAQNKNLADAFELRLFSGVVVKKSNARDKYLDQIYKSPREAILKSKELEYELLEFESNLWEY